ncbi:hypothetical protein EDB19DRAFT_1644925 [Suillus lakei]|nr:hypothetical protein EDB19DRAFT_1644925 [Suillus lakei]
MGIGLNDDAVERLWNLPAHTVSLSDDKTLEAVIKLYLGMNHADIDYDNAHRTFMELNDLDEFPSLYQVKKIVWDISGVESIVHNMCINLCIGFTGLFSSLSHCPECGEARFDQEKLEQSQGKLNLPRKQFLTTLLGQQLQALF